jgi:hypothetical protein
MDRHAGPLDDLTAERLLRGRVGAEDAPPGFAEVAQLVTTARSGLDPAGTPDPLFLSALVAATREQPTHLSRRTAVLARFRTAKVAAIAAGVVALSASAAAAATGNLPAPAQDALSRAADRVGFSLPASHDDNAGVDAPETPDTEQPDGHGATVSEVARDHTVSGRAHGRAVSDAARAGHGADDTEGDEPTGTDKPDNHGTTVSGVARDTQPGPDHGRTVADVARDGHGSPNGDDEGDDDAPSKPSLPDEGLGSKAPGVTDHSGETRPNPPAAGARGED